MKIYQDDSDVKIVHNIASASTLISSLAGIAREYIVSKFPKGYFRSIYMDTEEASSTFYKNQKYNKNTNKIPYPSLSIGTEISLDNPIDGMSRPREISATNIFIHKDLRRTYAKILTDPKNRFNLYYSCDYITTNFNFKIAVKKYIQNIDLAYYLKSMFQQDFFLYLNNQELNTEIPKTYIKILSEIANLDLSVKDDLVEFQDFIAQRSVTNEFVHKKTNLSTGNPCFFFSHNINVLSLFTDLDAPPAIIRNQMADDEYIVTFRLQLSTWLPNSFILSINKDQYNMIRNCVGSVEEENEEEINGFGSTSIHNDFRFEILRRKEITYLNRSNEECVGLEIFSDEYTYSLSSDIKEKKLVFELDPKFQKVYRYLNKEYVSKSGITQSFYIDDVFQVRAYVKAGDPALVSIDYEDGLKLSLSEGYFEDIYVSIYVDRAAVAAIEKAMETDTFFFKQNALTPMYIHMGGKELRVKVYSFESDLEKDAENINTSLRIMTPYGLGYIGLVEVDNRKASNYIICVGYNGTTPILKALELY